MSDLDRARVEAMAAKCATALKEHYAVAPPGNNAVLEALNALAMISASVLAGTGNSRQARGFFDKAVKQQVKHLMREYAHMSHETGRA